MHENGITLPKGLHLFFGAALKAWGLRTQKGTPWRYPLLPDAFQMLTSWVFFLKLKFIFLLSVEYWQSGYFLIGIEWNLTTRAHSLVLIFTFTETFSPCLSISYTIMFNMFCYCSYKVPLSSHYIWTAQLIYTLANTVYIKYLFVLYARTTC